MSIFTYSKEMVQNLLLIVRSGLGRGLREAGLQLDQKGSIMQKDIAYLEPFNRHRNIMALFEKRPEISPSAYVASNATIFGDVFVGQSSYFGFGTVARGDINPVRVGSNTKVGDNTVLESTHWGPDQAYALSTNIANNVNIEHSCALMSCLVDDDVHIGHRTVVMEGAQLERGCVIAPNSYVPAGVRIPAYTLWAGVPVKFVRELDESEKAATLDTEKEKIRIE